MVNLAYRNLTNPQIRKLRDREMAILAEAEQDNYAFRGFDIRTYFWKGGPDKVLLIHGWEGQAGNFTDMIPRLRAAGYSVYAFDGPSHGFSSRGTTNMWEFTDLVGELIQAYDVKKLVSHSFGGVATVYALWSNKDIEIDKYALLTSPDKFSQRIDEVAEMVGVTDKVKRLLIEKIETENDINVSKFNVSDFVKEIRVREALMLHDRDDKVIPLSRSENISANWPQCTLRVIEGTGHFRILRTAEVIDQVVDFLDN